MKIDFTNHGDILKLLSEVQDSDKDNRERAREAHDFIDKRDGQWDPDIVQKMKGRPRFTFDKCNPVVDQIAGEMEDADFTIRVSPSGGESSKDTAKTLDGIIRNIRNISNAEHVFNQAGRSMITAGLDGWEVVQDWVDADAFEQDLFIRKIPNFIDRVWFDQGAEMQDMSDAKWVIVLQSLTRAAYEDKFPKGEMQSIGSDRSHNSYDNKPDSISVGRILYKKPVSLEIVRMSNGKVYKVDKDFKKVVKELEDQGITEEKRRTRDSWRVHSRIFDGGGWLKKEQETVFDFLPVIPVFGNYKITDNKVLYRGVVEKLMDPQRVYNYAKSRQIEEGALAPKGKYWLTRKQASGNQATLETLNTNNDPVQLFNPDPDMPGFPQWQNGGTTNPGLEQTAISAANDLAAAANQFNAQVGNAPGQQSGIANQLQIQQGNIGAVKWFSAQEIAICQTGKILINAIPRVYDSTRQVRILDDDGTNKQITINDTILDNETGEVVELNNLTIGQYDVVCEVGDAFKSRQKESIQAFLDLATVDPTILQTGKDIMLKNMSQPGMDLMAERARAQLIQQHQIPFEQLTDEEKQQAEQAAQQPQEPSADMVFAQAEQQKADNQTQENQLKGQVQIEELRLKSEQLAFDRAKFEAELNGKFGVEGAKLDQGQQKIDLQAQKQMQDMAIKIEQLEQQFNKDLSNDIRENQKLASEQVNNETTQ